MGRRKLPAGYSEGCLKKKSSVGRLGHTWKCNIKVDLEEI